MHGDNFMVTEDGFRIMEWFFAVYILSACSYYMFEIGCLLSNWIFEIVGFVGKNKREAGEAIEKIVKKTRSV
jgi:hypothetical protein